MAWREALQHNVRTPQDLLRFVPLDTPQQEKMAQTLQQFPMSIPEYYLSLIDFSDPLDPIRKMCIPSPDETDLSGSLDTSGEASNTVVTGLQHKYRETAMVLSTNECAMYCRHCFRRRLVGISDEEIANHFPAMRAYVLAHPEINNVLISGGDALMNPSGRLRDIISLFVDIPHLDTIRIASRIPVVLPQRILQDTPLQEMLAHFSAQKQLHFITQFNHPREVTPEATAAVLTLQKLGLPVLNQAVLLQGVNDTPTVLGQLLRRLVSVGVRPYYVFQCRPVTGVQGRFQVPLAQGYAIVEEAKTTQSGLGKTLRYCMSHVTGKLEILGHAPNGDMLFKYHEAHHPQNLGKIFAKNLAPGQAWLEGKI